MKLTLGNLQFLSKKLQQAAFISATTKTTGLDMTPGESAVIDYLIEQGKPKTNKEIVEATGIVQSWVSNVVKSLLARGWIEIAPHKDKRVTAVKAKEEVIEKVKEIMEVDGSNALNQLVPGLTDAKKKKIQAGLELLYEGILEEAKRKS